MRFTWARRRAPGRIQLEAIGVNIGGSSSQSPDQFRPLVDDGPVAYRSELPLGEWSVKLRRAGIPAQVSYHAGTLLVQRHAVPVVPPGAANEPEHAVGFRPRAARSVADGGAAAGSCRAAACRRFRPPPCALSWKIWRGTWQPSGTDICRAFSGHPASAFRPRSSAAQYVVAAALFLAGGWPSIPTASRALFCWRKNHVEKNPAILQFWPPKWITDNHSRLLGIFSFALNYATDGLRVQGYYAVNLTVHVAAAGAFRHRTPHFGAAASRGALRP